jgi:hypothetical protein
LEPQTGGMAKRWRQKMEGKIIRAMAAVRLVCMFCCVIFGGIIARERERV